MTAPARHPAGAPDLGGRGEDGALGAEDREGELGARELGHRQDAVERLGLYYELYLYNAISKTDAAKITFGDESMAAIKVQLGTRRDGANLALPSWRLRIPA